MISPELISQFVTVLITGLVALLSARFGARSSIDVAERQVRATLETTEKNNRAALERIQYEKTHQRREEAIAHLYAGLRDLYRKFLSVRVKTVGTSVKDKLDESAEFEKALSEVRRYHDEHAIWLDTRSNQAIEKMLDQYLSHIGRLNMTFFTHPDEVQGSPEETSHLIFVEEGQKGIGGNTYEEVRAKLDQWAHEEYPDIEAAITKSFRDSLNIPDDTPDSESKT